MRNIQKLIAFLFVFVVWSCTTDDALTLDNDKENVVIVKSNGSSIPPEPTGPNSPTYSTDSLIVQYKNGTSLAEKAAIRAANNVGNFEICRCDDQDIELWFFTTVINVEPKRRAIKGQIDNESTTGLLEVDYEFVFGFDIGSPYTGTVYDVGYEDYINATNPGITIAILDTGIAPGLTVFNTGITPNDILFDASGTAVGSEKSGWDFVNEDPNTFDDDEGKHGSIIADMITSSLKTNGIVHQILPIKVSNDLGETSYFNFLCGTQYAMERAQIVNISMGWKDDTYGDHIESIFANIVEVHSNVIIVTSAGNTSDNNDLEKHYPSSYDYPNVIAVASSNALYSKISSFSNYGAADVDFFAQGEQIPFYEVYVQGTSFAAPQVTIEIINIFDNMGILSPEALRNELNVRGTPVISFFKLIEGEYRNTLYNKVIIPFD